MKKAIFLTLFATLLFAAGAAQEKGAAVTSAQARVGLPQDWSFRHLLQTGPIVGEPMNGQFHDPRAIYKHLQRQGTLRPAMKGGRLKVQASSSNLKRDWSFTLGPTAGMANGMSPAKYSFDINATPSCTNDFVIYTVAAVGGSSTPNIVGFNNIYAGTSTAVGIAASPNGATESGTTVTITTTAAHGMVAGQQVTIAGVTNTSYNGTYTIVSAPTATTFTYTSASSGLTGSGAGSATPLGLCGQFPTVKWAYNASTNGGKMKTSPVLSLDGAKIAFVEGSASGSKLQVLTLDAAGAGSFNSSTNVYTAATPGTMTTISLGPNDVTLSSPWVDYGTNSAYIGDDNGVLYHVACVFSNGCTTAVDYSCTVASGKILTGPVFDQTSQAVFIGASDGKVYRITGGSACTSASITVGDGTTTGTGVDAGKLVGGINDPPLLDPVFQVLYASSANGSGGQLVETGTGVGSAKPFTSALATISNGSSFYVVHSPAFSDAYFSNVSGTTITPAGNILGCAANNSKAAFLYSSPFSNANAATSTPLSPANPPIVGASGQSNPPGNASAGCSPMTEFNNGSDRIFFSQPASVSNKCGTGSSGFTAGCIFQNALTAGSPGTTYGAFMVTGGTSGIIVDNVSNVNGSGQTSSIYFGDLGSNTCSHRGTSSTGFCAVKLTQSSLR
jgi:hypothetical protein